MKKMNIAVIGATGAVGQEMFRVLEERRFPVDSLRGFASSRSEGKPLKALGQELKCESLKPGCFKGVDIAFFDASDAVSLEWVPQAVDSGTWVVDNSDAYRMDEKVPLLVPEVNGDLIESTAKKGNRIFAGPNCSTAQMVLPLKAMDDRWKLSRVIVSTYQSTSGAGSRAVEELKSQTRLQLDGKSVGAAKEFVHPIAFNCIPQVGSVKDDGFTSEEQKMMRESRKILGLPELRLTATTVRVPTLSCHGESLNVETVNGFGLDELRAAFKEFDGIELLDEPKSGKYPMPRDCAGRDPVYVGRVRQDPTQENTAWFWVVSDNLRKGAALNAVQIGEHLLKVIS